MSDSFNPVMLDCPVRMYGKLIINGEERGYNAVSFGFKLQRILSELGLNRIGSMQCNGYLYYLEQFNGEWYDLRDKRQYMLLRDLIIETYNSWLDFYKNKNK